MADPEGTSSKDHSLIEGKVKLFVSPSGGSKGPGSRGGVFYNPAMVQNRDLSILFLQYLLEKDLIPGNRKSILDGLCGSGARIIRLSKETGLQDNGFKLVGTDLNGSSIDTACRNAEANRADVQFINEDLNQHLIHNRYSYIDIDPFGTPVPFLQSAIQGVLNGGFLGITATDTAALTGSIPRVARRRYGIHSFMTHAYKEIACRSLMGYISRIAASFERSAEPVLFYASDHFIRGYAMVRKGARRSDSSLENVGFIDHTRPGPPSSCHVSVNDLKGSEGKIIGPIWTGPLEDPDICHGLIRMLGSGDWDHLASGRSIEVMLERAVSESGLPILGYDVNLLSSHLKISPPSMMSVFNELEGEGRRASRSRFSPTIFKTDAAWEEVVSIFLEGGE